MNRNDGDYRAEASSFFHMMMAENRTARRKILIDYLSVGVGMYAAEVGHDAACRALDNMAQALTPSAVALIPVQRPVDLDVLLNQIAALWSISPDALKQNIGRDKRLVVQARQHFMHSAYTSRRYTFKEVGDFLDGRDHTTVMAGVSRHQARLDGGVYVKGQRRKA